MARLSTTKRGKEKENYFNPGVVGRVTGVELPDKGVRDEHGMEPIEGIFSSAEKSTKSRRESNATISSEEDMEISQSSGPDPAEVLSERRAASARNAQSESARNRPPPPVSRSPIKTNIGATPRRHSSLGPVGSKRKSTTPRASTPRTAARVLKFGPTYPTNDPLRSNERSPERQNDDELSTPFKHRSSSPTRGRITELYDNDNDTEEIVFNDTTGDAPQFNDDDDEPIFEEQDQPLELGSQDPVPVSSTPKKTSTRKSDATVVGGVESSPQEVEEQVEAGANDESAAPGSVEQSPKRRRGRPSKATNIDVDDQVESATEPLAKRTRSSLDAEKAAVDPEPKKGKKRGPKPKQPPAKKLPTANGGSFTAPLPVRQQLLQRERHETPIDGAVAKTRSGRPTYKPLDYWKGERAVRAPGVYGATQWVVRMDDVTPVKRGHAPVRRKKKRTYTVFQDEAEDSDDGEEDWEKEDGVVGGPVKVWDPELPPGQLEEETEQELAFAAAKIVPREVQGSDFQFAKTLTLPFFGSGIVELPPHGFKRHKNSRKMQMCFFVHYGKVVVDVAGTEFTITKGGMWQVPRGNLYSIRNETEHAAKIFFAQGCESTFEALTETA